MQEQEFAVTIPTKVVDTGYGLIDGEGHVLLGIINEDGQKITLAFSEEESVKAEQSLRKMREKFAEWPKGYEALEATEAVGV